ncbi:protease, partial [Salmonella enterica subsp. enterica]
MQNLSLLLSDLALSVGLTLSAPLPVLASLLCQVPGQATLPSLAPMLVNVLPAVVRVKVEGSAAQSQKVPEEFK